jgi:hypothetical protein
MPLEHPSMTAGDRTQLSVQGLSHIPTRPGIEPPTARRT